VVSGLETGDRRLLHAEPAGPRRWDKPCSVRYLITRIATA
jgi:hypothetical protein